MQIPFWKSPPLRYDSPRTVNLNYEGVHTLDFLLTYPSNFIKTSKYTIVSFLPMSLLGQFKRYANIYFLFVAIIQSIPQISPLNPFSAIAPLVFVLTLSMLREGLEDITRHKSDNEVNAMKATILVDGKISKRDTTWADIRVGDIAVIAQDEMFPADLIVLGSQYESGVCYIETSSLDGEKNLKPKSALLETQRVFNQRECPFKDSVFALYEFDGSITMATEQKKGIRYLLSAKQLMLRGAFLRNTKWILGVVVYTGDDTKIMRNAEPSRVKQSNIELLMNSLILGVLTLQCLLCVVSAMIAAYWMSNQGSNHWYFWQKGTNSTLESFLVFFSYFLLYNTMIPISLIVSLEFVKVFQAYFIEKDEEMYVAARDKYAKANTCTINEELGQVEYIFSDKTGTLTCNQMEFKYCIVGNLLYGREQEEQRQELLFQDDQSPGANAQQINLQENFPLQLPPSPSPALQKSPMHSGTGQTGASAAAGFQHSIFTFKDAELQGIIDENDLYKGPAKFPVKLRITSEDGKESINFRFQGELIHEYFMLLASAHECLVQTDDQTGAQSYQGPSPDEITLVDAAMHMGFKYEGGSASEQTFSIRGHPKKVELLNSFEFDSTRKRMSVIIRDDDDQKIKLYIKGADNIIKSRLKAGAQPFLQFIDDQLNEFSKIGLRTLCMAMKVLSQDEYDTFYTKYAGLADADNREKALNDLTDALERDLYLIGATAVEDKLQYQVPETIADLLRANIKVWMLTGDKLETAENIARSCRLIQGDMTVMRFSETKESELRHKLVDNRMTYDLCIRENRKKSFLVEGEALGLIIGHKTMERDFVMMAQHCESVVCCRVTPKQKAQVVKLIKDNLNKITLAIGDGANDCNMIQEAHIGVGLYGNEGMRAVQSADFALGEFRCLWRLLLVHGHWSYIRIAEMILYFFYKNMIFTIPQFFFAFFSAFSAQTFFDDWYITFYNLFFTAIPLIMRATFDQDINYKLTGFVEADGAKFEFARKQEAYFKFKFPQLYYIGQQKTIFTIPNFTFWQLQGFAHGLLVFFIALGCFDYEIMDISGQPAGLSALSIIIYTTIIFIVDIKIALYTKFWTWFNLIGLLALSVLIYIIYFIISNFLVNTYSQATPLYLLGTSQFYLIILVLIAIVFIADLAVNQIIRDLFIAPVDQMLNFKHQVEHMLNSEPDIIKKIEEIQLDKREEGKERNWGDSFFEEIVEEKHRREREQHH